MNIPLVLADLSGQAVLNFLIWVVILALVYWVFTIIIAKIPLPPVAKTIIGIVLLVLLVVFLINALLTLTGTPFIRW